MNFCDPKLISNCFFFIWFWVSLLFSLLHFLILGNKQWLSIFNSNMILVVHLDSRFPQHFVGSNDESHHLCFAVFPFHRFLQRNQRNHRKSEKNISPEFFWLPGAHHSSQRFSRTRSTGNRAPLIKKLPQLYSIETIHVAGAWKLIGFILSFISIVLENRLIIL